MSSATVNPIAPRNIPAFAYHYDDAARHADAYLRGNDNTANNNSSSSSSNNHTNNNNSIWICFRLSSRRMGGFADDSRPETVGGLPALL